MHLLQRIAYLRGKKNLYELVSTSDPFALPAKKSED